MKSACYKTGFEWHYSPDLKNRSLIAEVTAISRVHTHYKLRIHKTWCHAWQNWKWLENSGCFQCAVDVELFHVWRQLSYISCTGLYSHFHMHFMAAYWKDAEWLITLWVTALLVFLCTWSESTSSSFSTERTLWSNQIRRLLEEIVVKRGLFPHSTHSIGKSHQGDRWSLTQEWHTSLDSRLCHECHIHKSLWRKQNIVLVMSFYILLHSFYNMILLEDF